jgi:hypothetical protein
LPVNYRFIFAFYGRADTSEKSGWLTHKGIIVNAYFQDISTSFGRRMKTIIVMKNKQLMFSDAWKGEIPLGVEVCIKEGRDGEIISIEEIEK